MGVWDNDAPMSICLLGCWIVRLLVYVHYSIKAIRLRDPSSILAIGYYTSSHRSQLASHGSYKGYIHLYWVYVSVCV